MKVKNVIELLEEYNPEADFVVINGASIVPNVEITYGTSEGVEKNNCQMVAFMMNTSVEKTNNEEK